MKTFNEFGHDLSESTKVHVSGTPGNPKEEEAFDKLVAKTNGKMSGMSSKGLYFTFSNSKDASVFKSGINKIKSLNVG
jgi:hypothetical protein